MNTHTIKGSQCEIEFCEPYYISPDTILKQPETIRRINTKKGRIYYTIDNGQPKFYQSVTTFIRRSSPMSPQLLEWMLKMGKEKAEAYSEERQHYGTFLHQEFARLMRDGAYELDSMLFNLEEYITSNRLDKTFINNLQELQKDLLAIAQWAVDYKVKPLAMEIILTHPDGYAGAIDLICKMTITEDGLTDEVYKTGKNKGQRKTGKISREITAIVDLKSGRHGFNESYEIQLQAYKNMVDHHFPEVAVERLYNVSPKSWRGKPSYNFTDQTGKTNAQKLFHMVKIAELDEMTTDRMQFVVEGEINLSGGNQSIENTYRFVSLENLIKQSKIK